MFSTCLSIYYTFLLLIKAASVVPLQYFNDTSHSCPLRLSINFTKYIFERKATLIAYIDKNCKNYAKHSLQHIMVLQIVFGVPHLNFYQCRYSQRPRGIEGLSSTLLGIATLSVAVWIRELLMKGARLQLLHCYITLSII